MLRRYIWTMAAVFLSLPARAVDFDREVAPLLASHCLDCHRGEEAKGGLDLSEKGKALAGGDSGKVIEPGVGTDSLLLDRVLADEMPPKHPLSTEEKKTLEQWIEQGAPWGTDPIDPFRISTAKRAGYDWWSLKPIQRPDVPTDASPELVHNPIDAFVHSKLVSADLSPSPTAEKRTLIRRLYFDLIGLPPTMEEVHAFLDDEDPDAYGKLVDRLLASPHHGERWARHWLDVVRYGETDGFERNGQRAHAWPYRNWVIHALNADMPYDQFCRWQLAGDLIAPQDPDAVTATGYLVAGVHNTVLGNDMMRAIARQDELEDVVGNVAQTFLGLTANCARCHDHKFDPISQQDYYKLTASLAGVSHGDRPLPQPEILAAQTKVRSEIGRVSKALKAIEAPARSHLHAQQRVPLTAAVPEPIASWDLRQGLEDQVGKMPLDVVGKVSQQTDGYHFSGEGYLRSAPLDRPVVEKTLEVWVRLDDLAQQGGGTISLQSLDGQFFDAIVFGEREAGEWMAGSNNFRRTRSFGGLRESDPDDVICFAIVYAADGTITGYRNGAVYGSPYQVEETQDFAAHAGVVLLGCRHEPSGGNRLLRGTILKANLYDRSLSADEVNASAVSEESGLRLAEVVAALAPEERAVHQRLSEQLANLNAEQRRLQETTEQRVYAAVAKEPQDTYLLRRGDVTLRGTLVSPGGIASVEGPGAIDLSPNAPEAERRRELAVWITNPENPLFARVIVNRLWHYHFGRGLVETPSDFGFNGGQPSHPELLDWLASELIANGFRLKPIHRLIVMSSTYQQSSRPQVPGIERDVENRLLWRKQPMRMEGEVLRDSMLAVAGLLNREIGGKGFSDYKVIDVNNGTTYYEPFDPTDKSSQRRSIYRFLPRGGNQGLLDAFDCPDSATSAPRRNQTTTPLQALELWNSPFTFRVADHLATEVKATAKLDKGRQVELMYESVLQRKPLPQEQTAGEKLLEKHTLRLLGRALLSSNEFLTIE